MNYRVFISTQTHDHQPLLKREVKQCRKEYSAIQVQNRGLYAVQGKGNARPGMRGCLRHTSKAKTSRRFPHRWGGESVAQCQTPSI
jgi:hypothetical protein